MQHAPSAMNRTYMHRTPNAYLYKQTNLDNSVNESERNIFEERGPPSCGLIYFGVCAFFRFAGAVYSLRRPRGPHRQSVAKITWYVMGQTSTKPSKPTVPRGATLFNPAPLLLQLLLLLFVPQTHATDQPLPIPHPSPHLSGNLRDDVVQETKGGHVEQLVAQPRPADDWLQHLTSHGDLRRTNNKYRR